MLQVKNTVEQIQRLRSNKVNAGLSLLVGPITVKLNNLAAMEVNTIRPFFQGSLNQFDSLSKVQTSAPSRSEGIRHRAHGSGQTPLAPSSRVA